MSKVAIVFVNDTRHVVACATAVGDLAIGAASELVRDGVFLRSAKGLGATVFLPAAGDTLKLATVDVSGSALTQLLTNPSANSLPADDQPPVVSAGTLSFASTTPSNPLQFTLAAPSRALKVVLAHQSGTPGSDNPAALITDTINPGDASKSIAVDYRTGDALALFVEGFLPVVM